MFCMFVFYISRQLLLSVPDVQRHDACRGNLRITAVHPEQPAACAPYTEVTGDGGHISYSVESQGVCGAVHEEVAEEGEEVGGGGVIRPPL